MSVTWDGHPLLSVEVGHIVKVRRDRSGGSGGVSHAGRRFVMGAGDYASVLNQAYAPLPILRL
jgi:hypothetical protein